MLPLFLLRDELSQAEQFVWNKLKIRRLSHRRKMAKSGMIFLPAFAKVKRDARILALPKKKYKQSRGPKTRQNAAPLSPKRAELYRRRALAWPIGGLR